MLCSTKRQKVDLAVGAGSHDFAVPDEHRERNDRRFVTFKALDRRVYETAHPPNTMPKVDSINTAQQIKTRHAEAPQYELINLLSKSA